MAKKTIYKIYSYVFFRCDIEPVIMKHNADNF